MLITVRRTFWGIRCKLLVSFLTIGAHGAVAGMQLDYSTLLGGSSYERIQTVFVDPNGYIYIGGSTHSADFPVTAGAYDTTLSVPTMTGYAATSDCYAAKISPDGGTIIWATYFGGGGRDDLYGIRVDDNGDVYATGWTLSTDFPTSGGAYDRSHNGQADIFVAKLSADGSTLIYSTFIGGRGLDQCRGALFVDSFGSVYFSGYTDSLDFPTTRGTFDQTFNGGFGDAVVGKLSADGSALLFSTYLGSSGADFAFSGLAVHTDGTIITLGLAGAADFPVTPGAYQTSFGGSNHINPNAGWRGDVFVARFSADGSALLNSTFIGGSGTENGSAQNALVLDNEGNAIICGRTSSPNFPVTAGAFQPNLVGRIDAFVAKLSLDGSTLLASTYLGGSDSSNEPIEGSGIAVDPAGNVFIGGKTDEHDFPVTADAIQTSLNGGTYDSFFSVLSSDLTSLHYSTLMGGNAEDRGRSLSLTPTGSVVVTGVTLSADFPVSPGAGTYIGNGDGYLMIFSPVITGQLIAHLDMDDGVGTIATDVTGNGNDGLLQGTAAWTTGKIGSGIIFDGSGGYVDVTDVDLTEAYTLALWIKPADVMASQLIVEKSWATITLSLENNIVLFTRNSGSAIVWESADFAPDTWHHLVVTFNTTNGSKLYVDGTLRHINTDATVTASDNRLIRLGANWNNTSQFFGGVMDDFRIYDYALPEIDVQTLYNTTMYPMDSRGLRFLLTP
jgi:hypothetical protein